MGERILKIYLQNKLMSILVLVNLIKGKRTLRQAEKDPSYWIISQDKSIKKFVNYIYDTIPFYRERFEKAGVRPEDIKTAQDFLRLPPLTKEEYRQWLLTETKDTKKYRYWMRRKTTGSSGSPLELYSLPRDRAAEISNLFRCAILQNKGYHALWDRVFSTMVPRPKKQKLSIPYNRQMSSISTPEELVKGYNETRPDFYYGNKTAVLMMAEYALEHNISLHKPKCVGSISEALDDNARNIIDRAFGEDKLFDIYGCAEVGNFAVERVDQKGKHIVWNDTHVINLLNPERDNSRPNYLTGQLMVTSLVHWGFPLVNYVIGDTVEVCEENGVKYITKIIGRTNDVIKNEDGSSFQWMHVNRLMFGITDVTQFRVVQKTYKKLIFVLAAKGLAVERKTEIEKLIKSRAMELFGDNPIHCKELEFQWCDRIPPDPTGKIRILVSEV